MNAELEERVRQKQRELERNFEKLQRLSREAAVAEERQRIMSDMHDGIGAQLISASEPGRERRRFAARRSLPCFASASTTFG